MLVNSKHAGKPTWLKMEQPRFQRIIIFPFKICTPRFFRQPHIPYCCLCRPVCPHYITKAIFLQVCFIVVTSNWIHTRIWYMLLTLLSCILFTKSIHEYYSHPRARCYQYQRWYQISYLHSRALALSWPQSTVDDVHKFGGYHAVINIDSCLNYKDATLWPHGNDG